MAEPTNEPPPVTRVEEGAEPPLVTRPDPGPSAPGVPALPRPGFWEAVLWCVLFVATQMLAAIAVFCVAFAAFTFSAPEPGKFFDEQLEGFAKALDPKAAERPPVPRAFGESLAWGMLAAQFASLGLIALVLPRRVGRDWKRQLGVRIPAGFHLLLVLLLVPGFMVGADAIQSALSWATGIRPEPMTGVLRGVFGTFPWALTLLAVAIGPGVVEEFWCRGFIGRGLCARYGIASGVLLTSMFFALMHGSPAMLIVYTAMGAYLHFVYLATRSIWPPVLLHAANNGLAILIELTVSPDKLNNVPPGVVYLACFSLLLFGSIALWTGRAEVQPVSAKQPPTDWQPEYPGVSEPPPEANAAIGYASASPVAILFTFASFGTLIYLGYRFLM